MRARGCIRVRSRTESGRDALSHEDRTALSGLLQRQPTPQPGWALFQVVPWGGGKGEGHETIVRGSALAVTQAGGNLADALKALKAPTARTVRPVPPPPKPPPKKKSSASSRPRGRGRTRVP
jgi:hypothetical protein